MQRHTFSKVLTLRFKMYFDKTSICSHLSSAAAVDHLSAGGSLDVLAGGAGRLKATACVCRAAASADGAVALLLYRRRGSECQRRQVARQFAGWWHSLLLN